MKKTLIILIILIALLAAGAWVYVIIFGPTTKGVEVLTNFTETTPDNTVDTGNNGVAESTNEDVTEAPIPTNEPFIQLTDRPVAGAVFLNEGDDTFVRFMERGTAHVYEVSLTSGVTKKMSNTTLQKAVQAVWAPSGARVAVAIEEDTLVQTWSVFNLRRNDNGDFFLEEVRVLPQESNNIAFNDVGDTVSYTLSTDSGAVGVAVDLKTDEEQVVWNTPLRDIVVSWHESDTLHMYTKPSGHVSGYLYALNGQFTRIGSGVPGLAALGTNRFAVISSAENNTYLSRVHNKETGEEIELGIAVFPQKCTIAPLDDTFIYCAAPFALPNALYPDDWLQGEMVLNDQIWEVDLVTGSALLIGKPQEAAGVSIDVSNMWADLSERYILVKNKIDQSLWLLDREA